jgi:cephalosporin hydroxylase
MSSSPTLRSLVLEGTDKDTTHSYIDVYEKLFTPIRSTAKNILEIGVQTGQSIMLWSSYFDDAAVYGLDINVIPPILNKLKNVYCARANAYDVAYINENFVKNDIKFDVIIDDGPHTLQSMLFCAEHYTKLLSDTGILIIEDVQSIDWVPHIIKAFPQEYQKYVTCEDRRNIKGRYDDILVILDKRSL